MKITKRQLKRIIREENQRILSEQFAKKVSPSFQGIKVALQRMADKAAQFNAEGGPQANDIKEMISNISEAVQSLEMEFYPGDRGRTPTEKESGIPDSQRSVMHNRRPEW